MHTRQPLSPIDSSTTRIHLRLLYISQELQRYQPPNAGSSRLNATLLCRSRPLFASMELNNSDSKTSYPILQSSHSALSTMRHAHSLELRSLTLSFCVEVCKLTDHIQVQACRKVLLIILHASALYALRYDIRDMQQGIGFQGYLTGVFLAQ